MKGTSGGIPDLPRWALRLAIELLVFGSPFDSSVCPANEVGSECDDKVYEKAM